jgi:hypothetical protein
MERQQEYIKYKEKKNYRTGASIQNNTGQQEWVKEWKYYSHKPKWQECNKNKKQKTWQIRQYNDHILSTQHQAETH